MNGVQPGSLMCVITGLDHWFESMRVDWPTPGYGGSVVHSEGTMNGVQPGSLMCVITGLDHWFESMRVDWPTPGYGGSVVHWWSHSLAYRGAGLDWRYEGIIAGYLTLWRTTAERLWLERAVRAGSDLVEGQLADGRFRNSSFELNPGTGGTPHEAAADVGLLLLARELRYLDPVSTQRFLSAARRNLELYWFGKLWHEPTATLRDSRDAPTFVPNKAATFIDAVLLLSELTERHDLIGTFAIPTAAKILDMQEPPQPNEIAGAIAQNRFGEHVIKAYFPLYIARIVPPLVRLYERTGDPNYLDAALAAARFLERVREPDGGFPQVIYGNGKQNRRPRWIAGSGDILRAFIEINRHGADVDIRPTLDWLLRGVRSDGHIATAEGFDRLVPVISRRDRSADELGVVGWCDKAFRALALLARDERPRLASADISRSLAATGSVP